MRSAVGHAFEVGLRRDAFLGQEVTGHQVARGRTFAAEGEGTPFEICQRGNARVRGGHKHRREVFISAALGHGLGARNREARLHAGQAAVPGQLDIVVVPSRDQGGVGLGRKVTNLDSGFLSDVFGEKVESSLQDRDVLVGNAAHIEDGLLIFRAGGGRQQGRDQEYGAEARQETLEHVGFTVILRGAPSGAHSFRGRRETRAAIKGT